MKQVEQLWEKLVLLLADRLEARTRGAEGSEEVEAHQQVDLAAQRLADELREGAEKISQQRDAPPELWRALSNIADGMRPRVQGTVDARRMYLRYMKLDVPDVAPSRRLTRASETEVSGLEKDVVYLESLLDRQKLEDLKELMRQLNSERRSSRPHRAVPEDAGSAGARGHPGAGPAAPRAHPGADGPDGGDGQGIRDEHLNAEALKQLSEQKDMNDASRRSRS